MTVRQALICALMAASVLAQTIGPSGGGSGSAAKVTLPFVTPETYGAVGNGKFVFDGSITPPSMPHASATGTSTTPTTTSITTPAANSLVVFAGLGNAAWSASMTGANQVAQSFTAGNYAINVSTQTVVTSGSSVSGSGTLASSVSWVASSVALGPASGKSIAQVGTWTSVQTASTSTVVVTTPAGVSAGDVLVAVIDWYNHAMTPPAGWVLLDTATDGGGDIQAAYYYVAGPSTPASFTWTQTGTSGMAGAMGAYSGVNTASTVTSATAGFTSGDVGDLVCTAGTSASGAQQCGTITAYNSATSVAVSYIAGNQPANDNFVYGHDDTAALNAMMTTAPCSTVGCNAQFAAGKMYMDTAPFAWPDDVAINWKGGGFGLPYSENSFLNGNTAPNANTGTRINFATTSLSAPAIAVGGTAGVTSTAGFDSITDMALYAGAGHARDGGGNWGISVRNWQGFRGRDVAVVNFSTGGVLVDGVTGSSYKDYIEQIVWDGLYALWNGGPGYELGQYTNYINNIETDAVVNSVLENNGGPGIYLAGKAIQGFSAYNDVIQWNNVAAPNPEVQIGYPTGANAPQACTIRDNYVEVDTNGGSQSSSWITANANCSVWNNFIPGNVVTGYASIGTTSPTMPFTAVGGIANGCSGSATLAAGTVTVSNACILGTRPITVTEVNSGTPNAVGVSAQSAGSLTIKSASGTDTSTVYWSQQ